MHGLTAGLTPFLLTARWRDVGLSCLVGCVLVSCAPTGEAAESTRVMTFNLWEGGDAGKQPLSQTLEVIRAAKADVVGLQETLGRINAGTRRTVPWLVGSAEYL